MSLRAPSLRALSRAASSSSRRAALPTVAKVAARPAHTAQLPQAVRTFSASASKSYADVQHGEFQNPFGINSLAKLTEEEEMLREAGE